MASIRQSSNAIEIDVNKDTPTAKAALSTFSKFTINVALYQIGRAKADTIDGFPKDFRQNKEEVNQLLSGRWYKIQITPKNTDDRELVALQASLDVKTNCGCTKTNLSSTGESTGSPVAFQVSQNIGRIRFSWVDQSMCEEGFSFYRLNDANARIIFTEDYNYASSDQCSAQHNPQEVFDDLAISNLPTGSTQKYCVMAMDHNTVDPYFSNATCTSFMVQWESILSGNVHLGEEQGKLPVVGVQIQYTIGEQRGSVLTDVDGNYKIHIKTAFFKEIAQIITIQPYKLDGNISHTFKCGDVNCSNQLIELKHLDFSEIFDFEDSTSINFRGSVVVKDTFYGNFIGCGMKGVLVCLVDIELGNQLSCVNTTFTGEFSIPVAVGTTVRVKLIHPSGEHQFQRIPNFKSGNFNHGMTVNSKPTGTDSTGAEFYKITAIKVWEAIDFWDIQTESLTLQVAGGKCNRVLGVTQFELSYGECKEWKKYIGDSQVYSQKLAVPAQTLNVKIVKVTSQDGGTTYPDITNYFDLVNQRTIRIDLSNIPANSTMNTKNLPNTTDVQSVDPRIVRFEYHPSPVLNFAITPKAVPCTSGKVPYVVPADTAINVSVFVSEKFGNGAQDCDWVEGEMQIVNSLGETSAKIQALTDSGSSKYTQTQLDMLGECNNGCNKTVIVDDCDGKCTPKKARVDLMLMTGSPEVNPDIPDPDNNAKAPYSKLFTASFWPQGRGVVRINPRVVVIGVIIGNAEESIVLPEYLPLLVLHDPPGGGSFAEYKNTRRRVSIKLEGVTQFGGMTFDLSGQHGFGLTIDTCTGVGVMVCAETSKVTTYVNPETAIDYEHRTNDDSETTATFEFEIDYKTSSEPKDAGMFSDSYLIPSLSIVFSSATKIGFNKDTCLGTSTDSKVWQLGRAGNNRAMFSWITHRDITERELPKIKYLLELENNKSVVDKKKTAQLTTGIQGWEQILKQTSSIYSRAKSGTLDKVTTFKKKQWNRYTGLAPQQLLSSAVLLDNATADKTLLDSIYTLQFFGGGSEYSYQIATTNHLANHRESADEFHQNVGLSSDFEIKSPIWATVHVGGSTGGGKETRNTPGTEDDTTETVSFSLSDPDDGDSFLVDVLIDPTYNTYVFNTVAGSSKCPVEPNTIPREAPAIELVLGPLAPPPANLPAIFQILLKNTAAEEATYNFFIDAGTNADDLKIVIDGSTGGKMVSYTLAANSAVNAVVEIWRGPLLYKYKDVYVGLKSQCDEDLKVRLPLTIEFLQPCPVIKFAGTLLESKTFVVNKSDSIKAIRRNLIPIVASNPESYTRKWAQEPRLQLVEGRYRAKGTQEWYPCLNSSSSPSNFIPLESKEGYATLFWDVSRMLDGYYELQLRTKCNASSGSDIPGIDEYTSEVFTGLVDRKSPEQFGATEPKSGKFVPGDYMSVSFDEDIMCSKPFRFSVSLQVAGLDRTFNEKNMLVICEGRKITIAFTALENYQAMMNKTATLTIKGVEDLAGNVQTVNAIASFTVANIDVSKAFVEVQSLHLSNSKPDMRRKQLQSELAHLLRIQDPKRIKIKNVRQPLGNADDVELDLSISPETAGSTVNTIQAHTDDLSQAPLQLIKNLYDYIEQHDKYVKSNKLIRHKSSIAADVQLILLKHARLNEGSFLTKIVPYANDVALHRAFLWEPEKPAMGHAASASSSESQGKLGTLVVMNAVMNAVIMVAIVALVVFILRSKRNTVVKE